MQIHNLHKQHTTNRQQAIGNNPPLHNPPNTHMDAITRALVHEDAACLARAIKGMEPSHLAPVLTRALDTLEPRTEGGDCGDVRMVQTLVDALHDVPFRGEWLLNALDSCCRSAHGGDVRVAILDAVLSHPKATVSALALFRAVSRAYFADIAGPPAPAILAAVLRVAEERDPLISPLHLTSVLPPFCSTLVRTHLPLAQDFCTKGIEQLLTCATLANDVRRFFPVHTVLQRLTAPEDAPDTAPLVLAHIHGMWADARKTLAWRRRLPALALYVGRRRETLT